MVGDGADCFLQAGDEQVSNSRVDLIVVHLVLMQGIPVARNPVEHGFQRLWRVAPQYIEHLLIKLGGIHAARAVNQVMRLVYQ